MEAVRTSETSVYSNETTRCYITESSNLHEKKFWKYYKNLFMRFKLGEDMCFVNELMSFTNLNNK
jgi:hypothetical protein